MEVVILSDEESASRLAARLVVRGMTMRPNAVLGLATGRTPIAVYRELVRLHRDEGLSFRDVHTFNLDEYVGISGDHPASCRAFMKRHLFDAVDLNPQNVRTMDGGAADIEAECARYEQDIRRCGGLDLQILGIGTDGHIGFNEPGSSLGSRTRIKTLSEKTRRDNAPLFGRPDDVPRHVVTMGVGTILEARRCVLLAFGSSKADAVARAVEGPVTAMVPASALQLHPDAKAILDERAASRLALREYYVDVYRNKPSWQAF
jgi:glucosamine-6-phosphate deaminase